MKSLNSNLLTPRWLILAGGVGSRLKSLTGSLPKCMVPVAGKPLIFHQIERLQENGVNGIDFLLGYNANLIVDDIQEYCEEIGIDINIYIEDEPLGTGGALLQYWKNRPEPVGVLHGDLYIDLDIQPLTRKSNTESFDWKQLVHPSTHLFDSDIVESDSFGHILNYHLKPHRNLTKIRNRTNAGVYFFEQGAIDWVLKNQLAFGEKFDLDRDLIPAMQLNGLQGIAIENFGYCRDIGTLERHREVEDQLLVGLPSRRVKPMIFLDRDGIINQDFGHIKSLDEFQIIDGVIDSIRELNSLGVWVVVVTNQPVIARGELTVKGLSEIHSHLEASLAHGGAYLNDVYFCPHHPEGGHPGEVLELKIDCTCRKPKPGLLLQALEKYPTDIERSVFVGDSLRDQQAAESIGVKFIGIRSALTSSATNNHLFQYTNLYEALDAIKSYVTK